MPQKTFTVKFSQKVHGNNHVKINASAYPYGDATFIGADDIPCSVFNWLRKILPDNKITKGKVIIIFEE